MAADIFVAVESVLTQVDGENVYITAGQTARAGHPILVGREALFEPFKVDYELDAPAPEQAPEPTAADVRKWAADQGIDVAAKGALPADVVELYKAAHG